MRLAHTVPDEMGGAKALTPEQNERLRDAVRDLLRRHDGNQTVLAPKLGVSQSTLSGFIGGRQGTSYAVAGRVADLLRVDERELLHGRAPLAARDNRTIAADLARDDGISETAISSVLAEEFKPGDPRTVLFWAFRMKQREMELVLGDAAAKARRKP
jgi:transcriptional regulator with XRE-family HTH domain